MKKIQLTGKFNVNLQQGFILVEHEIIAAFSHHHKTVVMKHPNHSNQFNWLASTFEHYTFLNGMTDSFGLNCYTHDGDKDLSSLIISAKG